MIKPLLLVLSNSSRVVNNQDLIESFISLGRLSYHMVESINNIKLEIISLYRTGYFGQFHTREMAKLIGKSHVGLLPHLKKFEKDKILVSKQVGRSKVYSLNFNNPQVKEFLSLSEKRESLEFLDKEFFVKKIYEEIASCLQGSLVLFGSYASFSHTKESDVDLLYIGEIKDGEKVKINEFCRVYGKKVHLVSMNRKQFREQLLKQNPLVKEIIKNHIILCNHDIFINELWGYYNERKER